jgi:hypothetical protein
VLIEFSGVFVVVYDQLDNNQVEIESVENRNNVIEMTFKFSCDIKWKDLQIFDQI